MPEAKDLRHRTAASRVEKKEDAAACQRSANHAPARANELSVRVKKGTKGRLLVTLRLRHRILGIGVASILLIPALVSAQDAKKGAAQFKAAGCNGCHKINGEPANATMGPDLSHEGKMRKSADIRKKIENPKVGMPNSIMPAAKDLGLKPAQVADLTAYLSSLK
jgi:cytochrome c553